MLLKGYQALDLTDEKGWICGRVLGDLGVDVIKIETPGGDPSRNRSPFYHGDPHPEKSLNWFAFNANKKGITLDLGKTQGQQIFKKLVARSNFVIESFPPGHMEGLGLGYSSLSQINPRIILTSITPYGQRGPYRDHKTSDLISSAMGGVMYLTGESDRPPVRMGYDQTHFIGGSYAALATLCALYRLLETGEGQHVDLSIHECVAEVVSMPFLHWEFGRKRARRNSNSSFYGRRFVWPCRDGYVVWGGQAGIHGAEENRALLQWMAGENMADMIRGGSWQDIDFQQVTLEELITWHEPIERFFLSHTKSELFEEALRRGIRFCPLWDIREVVENEHLAARGYWVEIEHRELDTAVRYPGRFLTASPEGVELRGRAPLIGEHNREIYEGELGLSNQEVESLKQANII